MSQTVKDKLKELTDRVGDLPTLPAVYHRISNLVDDPRSSAMDVQGIIEEDQTLTSKLLNLANSALYGFPGRIPTVGQAVVVLGFQEVRNIVLSTSVLKVFRNAEGNGHFDCQKFWEHSIACAVCSRLIAQYMKSEHVEEIFVAGLLHDIGKLIHLQYLPEEFNLAVDLAADRNILLREAEMEVMGHTHAHSGGLLAKKWRLPQSIAQPIRFHHELSVVSQHILPVSIVHLADILCRALQLGSGGDRRIPYLDHAAWLTVGLTYDDLELIMIDLEKEFETAVKILLG